MKILVVGNSTWDDSSSVGNTLSNWFEGWNDTEFAFMYSRDAMPDNKCCKKYYSVSAIDIVKHILNPWKIGREFNIDDISIGKRSCAEENALNNITGCKRKILRLAVDLLYDSNIWFNKKAKMFISDFNPDIVFAFSISDAFRYNIVDYCKRKTKAKIVEFIADDMYNIYCTGGGLLNKLHKHRFPKLLHNADKLYGATEQMCIAYNSIFGLSVEPLYKGCLTSDAKTTVNTPIKMIYAGNLQWGRAETLIQLIETLERINKDGTKIKLSIYSNSFVEESLRKRLNSEYGSHLYDAVSYSRIKKLMEESDIVLQVESFDDEQIQLVRYSFSTKIIDCLQSGSVLMAIGPKCLASMEYIHNIPGSIVVNDASLLYNILRDICGNPKQLISKALSINQYAKEHHNISDVRNRLNNTFKTLLQ